jgi:hypothetical protein
MRSLTLAKIEHAREPWLSWPKSARTTGGAASIPARELPVGQAMPRRLVNVRIPRILIGMQECAEEAGLDLSGGSFVLPPDRSAARP